MSRARAAAGTWVPFDVNSISTAIDSAGPAGYPPGHAQAQSCRAFGLADACTHIVWQGAKEGSTKTCVSVHVPHLGISAFSAFLLHHASCFHRGLVLGEMALSTDVQGGLVFFHGARAPHTPCIHPYAPLIFTPSTFNSTNSMTRCAMRPPVESSAACSRMCLQDAMCTHVIVHQVMKQAHLSRCYLKRGHPVLQWERCEDRSPLDMRVGVRLSWNVSLSEPPVCGTKSASSGHITPRTRRPEGLNFRLQVPISVPLETDASLVVIGAHHFGSYIYTNMHTYDIHPSVHTYICMHAPISAVIIYSQVATRTTPSLSTFAG